MHRNVVNNFCSRESLINQGDDLAGDHLWQSKLLAYLAFDRPPPGVRDAVALDPDLSAAHPHGPALRRGEPLADQVGQHVGVEAIGEQPSFGAAAWTAGDQL